MSIAKYIPFNHFPAPDETVKGVILSGSPFSVRDAMAPFPDLTAIKGRIPLLGVCYGAQHLTHNFGGEVLPSDTREYGRARLVYADQGDPLFQGITHRHTGLDVSWRHHISNTCRLYCNRVNR